MYLRLKKILFTSLKGRPPMTTTEQGMEAGNVTKNVQTSMQEILSQHNEALVIIADPDPDFTNESTIAVYSKLQDKNGILAPMLAQILRNLLESNDGKCGDITSQAPIDT
jgi:hypothetical protein